MQREKYYINEAWNTLLATRWQLLLVRIFGRKRITRSIDGDVILREWRGKLYFVGFVRPNASLSGGRRPSA